MDEAGNQHMTKKERRASRRTERRAEQEKRSSRHTARRAAIWTGTAVALVAVVFGGVRLAARAPSESGVAAVGMVISAQDQKKGSPEAAVTLVEYSDFQCPACRASAPLVTRLAEEFGNSLQFVYRHFPLRQHDNAERAAQVSEAAGMQGKFWEMHDMLFDGQDDWAESRNAEELFLQYAESLGLNKEQFARDSDSDRVHEKVTSDFQSGLQFGVDATPTFFLDGERLTNPRDYDSFKTLITEKLDAS